MFVKKIANFSFAWSLLLVLIRILYLYWRISRIKIFRYWYIKIPKELTRGTWSSPVQNRCALSSPTQHIPSTCVCEARGWKLKILVYENLRKFATLIKKTVAGIRRKRARFLTFISVNKATDIFFTNSPIFYNDIVIASTLSKRGLLHNSWWIAIFF